jgi:DNA recombination protein RmuC
LDISTLFIGFLLGALLSGLLVLLLSNRKLNAAKSEALLNRERAETLQTELSRLRQEFEKLQGDYARQSTEMVRKETEYEGLQQRLSEQKEELQKIQERFSLEFSNLANRIFDDKAQKFKLQSEESISKVLDPLRQSLGDFSSKVERANKDALEGNSALREQLKNLKELNQKMVTEAENLTKALKGDTKAQGNWGEMILETVLEKSGLVKGREYEVQESFRAEDGGLLRPDVTIKLPEDKRIIVDSKVSLVAYERFSSEDDDEKRKAYLRQHIQSIRAHVKGLNEKNYAFGSAGQGLDFVLLFIPIEPAFSLAVQYDAELFTDSFSKNIVIVSPSTLLATLRTIASIWRQEYQNQNAQEIAKAGGDLYDQLVSFTEDLQKVGLRITAAGESLNSAMNRLSTGRGNLLRRAENMKKLGIKASKSLPPSLIEEDKDSE